MNNRREFLRLGLAASGAFVSTPVYFSEYLKDIPFVAELEKMMFFKLQGKSAQMRVLNEKPINAETPAHLLNDSFTPNDLFFVRNNGLPPKDPSAAAWRFTVKGESAKQTKTFSIADLKSQFETVELYLTLECGGNGRSEFNPPAKGNQWSTGAVGCAKWTGVRLKDVLNAVGVKGDAVYVAYKGRDTHLSGDPEKDPISRGVPISKAMQDESMIAWAMNDKPLPYLNGFPLRLVFGGWPASCSGKWLSELLIRDKVHDGAKMGGSSYRVPKYPVAPDTNVPSSDMKIIEAMPVKSLITYPKSGAIIAEGKELPIAGHAWVGDSDIEKVEYSIDFGREWEECELGKAKNKNAWQRWEAKVSFPGVGYFEVWVRATDRNGNTQSMLVPGWNPKGYLNNACHRIAIKVQ